MRILKTFSFTEKDKDVINRIEQEERGMQSRYIKELVRKDIKNSEEKSIEQLVNDYIEKYLANKQISIDKKDKKDVEIAKDEIEDLLEGIV